MDRSGEIRKRVGGKQWGGRKVSRSKWLPLRLLPWAIFRTTWPELAGLMAGQLRKQGYLATYFDRPTNQAPFYLRFIVVGVRPVLRWLLPCLKWADTRRPLIRGLRLVTLYVLGMVLFFGYFWLLDKLFMFLFSTSRHP